MSRDTTPKALPLAERKKRLGALVRAGKVSARRAALIDFRDPSVREREHGERIAARVRGAKVA